MKKQKLTLTGFFAMFLSLFIFLQPAHASASFADQIPMWASDSVDNLVEKGVIQGYPDGTFKPDQAVTRAEAAAMLTEVLGLEMDENAQPSFYDVQNHWASEAITALQNQKPGVVDGYADGSFKPNQTITRQEMAKMIVAAYDLERYGETQTYFHDNTGWGAEAVNTLASLGIVHGVAVGEFDSNADVTRAQAAVFIDQAHSMSPIATNPEYQTAKTIEQDGIELEVSLNKDYGRLFVKATATNINEDPILYVANNGCDYGFSANLFDGNMEVGSTWGETFFVCNQAVRDLILEPGETAEETGIINPPQEGFQEGQYLEVIFHKANPDSYQPSEPIKVEVPIE